VLSCHDSRAAPQTVQTASPVCGTKNFSSLRLYSAPQLHCTIVAIPGVCASDRRFSSPELCHNRTNPLPTTAAVPDEESPSQTRPQRTQSEQMSSGLPLKADVALCRRHVSSGCSRLAQSWSDLLSGADVFDGLSGILVRTHELSSGLRQRTSAAPPGQTSAYLCIPLLSLLMPRAYTRTIERRREVFILTATPKGRTSSSQLLSPKARLTIAIVVLQRAPVAFRNL
jgi:hypothetical protein